MNPTLLLPAALAAVSALIIPLVIHLSRRNEQRPTEFAALRWLRQKPRPRQRLRFDELPLLAARLLLLALIALWLARPALYGSADTSPWIAIVPGVDVTELTLDAPKSRRHWLAPGFPALDTPRPSGPVQFASLLRQLDAELPPSAKLSVYVPAQLSGADGMRPILSRAVAWHIVPGAMAMAAAARSSIPSLTIRYAPGRQAGISYFRAAAMAWQQPQGAVHFNVGSAKEALPAGGNLVWLVPGTLPATVTDWIKRGGTALLDSHTAFIESPTMTSIWRDETGLPLVDGAALGQGSVLRFTRALNPEAMPQLLDPDFPRRLRMLFARNMPHPAVVDAAAYAPVTGGATYPRPARDLRPWLALVAAAALLTERWLATGRRASNAP